jgi:hypothetical protein
VEASTPAVDEGRSEHGLKTDAIGFIDGLIIGVASTAPAYSLAAVLAIVVVLVGVQAPAVLLASFIPMFLIASSFYYMNRANPDCRHVVFDSLTALSLMIAFYYALTGVACAVYYRTSSRSR